MNAEERAIASLSGSRSYEELSDYWDTHSLADHWDETSAVEFELNVKSPFFAGDLLIYIIP